MLLPEAGEATSKPKNNKKTKAKEQKGREEEVSKKPDSDAASGGLRLPLLPAPLLGATLHVLRTPHSAGRLAYLLVKASEVAARAEAAAAEEEEEEERRAATAACLRNNSNSGKKKKKAPASSRNTAAASLSALRLAAEPLARIPGDDLPRP